MAKFLENKDAKIQTQRKGGTTILRILYVQPGPHSLGLGSAREPPPFKSRVKVDKWHPCFFIQYHLFSFVFIRNNNELSVIIIFHLLGIRDKNGYRLGFNVRAQEALILLKMFY